MKDSEVGARDTVRAAVRGTEGLDDFLRPHGVVEVTAYDEDGNVKWREEQHNLVVNEGLDHILSSTLAGGTQITTWYIGLTDGTPTLAAGDTMSSHAGWAEVTDYDEAARQTWSAGAVSSQSVDNSGTVASFSINASVTVGGVFMVSDSTKGGTAGTLYSEVAFGSDRSLSSGDTLEITYTHSMADDGT
jgi:hypothetical protein